MRVVPLGLAALLWTGAALAQTNTPHTDPGRSGISNAPVGGSTAPGAVTNLGGTARDSGAPGTTAQGTPQGQSTITNAPVGAGASGTAPQGTTRP